MIRNCDMHHNTLGYSGTMGNATRVTDNQFYDNAHRLSRPTRSTPAATPASPRTPPCSSTTSFYSNNFNPSFEANSDVDPYACPSRSASGIWIAGGNNNEHPQQPLLRQLAARDDAADAA